MRELCFFGASCGCVEQSTSQKSRQPPGLAWPGLASAELTKFKMKGLSYTKELPGTTVESKLVFQKQSTCFASGGHECRSRKTLAWTLLIVAALQPLVGGSTHSSTLNVWPQPWFGQRWPSLSALLVSPASGHAASSGKVLDVSHTGLWLLMSANNNLCIALAAGTSSQCYVATQPIVRAFFVAEPAGCSTCGISSLRAVALSDSGIAASLHWIHFDTNAIAVEENTLSLQTGTGVFLGPDGHSVAIVGINAGEFVLANNSAPWNVHSATAIPLISSTGAVCSPSLTSNSLLFSRRLSVGSNFAAVDFSSPASNTFRTKVAVNDMDPLEGCVYLNIQSDPGLAIFGQMDGYLVVGWDMSPGFKSPRWTATLNVPFLSPDTHFHLAHNKDPSHMVSAHTAGAVYLEDRLGVDGRPCLRAKVTADNTDGWSASFPEAAFRLQSESALYIADILAVGVTSDLWLLLEVLDSDSVRSLRLAPLGADLRSLVRKTDGSSPSSALSLQGNTVIAYFMPATASVVAFHPDFLLLQDSTSVLTKLALALPSPTPSTTNTPSSSVSPSRSPTSSASLSSTPTPSRSASVSRSPSRTPSQSPSSTFTASPTRSSSTSPSRTPTASITPTITPSSSVTPSRTPTPSMTPSRTPTSSVTPTNTPSPTNTPVLIDNAADACRGAVQCDFQGYPVQFREANVWCEDCTQQQSGPVPLLADSDGSNLVRCPRPGSCVQLSLPVGRGAAVGCREGHSGPLCASCSDGYFSDDICGECKECQYNEWTQYIAVGVSMLAFIGVIVFSSFRAYKQAGKINVDLLTGTMRIMTQFVSIIGIAIAANTFGTILPAAASSQALELSTWTQLCGVQELGTGRAPASAATASSGTDNRWAFARWGDQSQLIYGWEAATNTFGRFVGASSVVRDGSLECLLPQNSFQLHGITGLVGTGILLVFCGLLVSISCLPHAAAGRQISHRSAAQTSRQASRLEAEQVLSPQGGRLAAVALSVSVVYYSLWNTVQTSNLILLSKSQKLGKQEYWSAGSYTWSNGNEDFEQMRQIAMFGLILHGAVVPLAVFSVLMCFPDSALLSAALKLSLSYFTGAYRRVTAWFEMVRLLERLLAFFALYLVFQKDQRTLLIVAANAATLLALAVLKPYSLDELNSLDKLAHLGMFTTSLCLAVIPPSFALYLVLLVLNVGIGMSIFSVWLRAASKSVRTKLAKINAFLRNKFPELGEEYAPPPTVEEVEYVNAAPPSLRDWLRLLGRRAGCIGKPKRKKRVVYLQPAHSNRTEEGDDEFLPASACRDAFCPQRAAREELPQPQPPRGAAQEHNVGAAMKNPLAVESVDSKLGQTPSSDGTFSACQGALTNAPSRVQDSPAAVSDPAFTSVIPPDHDSVYADTPSIASSLDHTCSDDAPNSSSASSPSDWYDRDLMAWEGVSISVTMGEMKRAPHCKASFPALLSPKGSGGSSGSGTNIGSISNPMRDSLTRTASFKRTFGGKAAATAGGDAQHVRRSSGAKHKTGTPAMPAADLSQNRESRARRNSNWLKQMQAQQDVNGPSVALAMPGVGKRAFRRPARGRGAAAGRGNRIAGAPSR